MAKVSIGRILYIVTALLFIQWTGCHLHLGSDLQSGEMHALHAHQHEDAVHDHATDSNISLTDIQKSWFQKYFPFLISAALVLLIYQLSVGTVMFRKDFYQYSQSSFWRPILRAPPYF